MNAREGEDKLELSHIIMILFHLGYYSFNIIMLYLAI